MPGMMESRSEKVAEVVSDRNLKPEGLNGITKLESFRVGAITNGSSGKYPLSSPH
jgi:hypothetical protein